jgi:hypothetical protein
MILANLGETPPPQPPPEEPCVECAAQMNKPPAAIIVLGFSGSERRNALCAKHVAELLKLLGQEWILAAAEPFKNQI